MASNRARRVAKDLLPPLVARSLGRLRPGATSAPWEGVYAHRRDVPTRGAGFGGPTWVREVEAYLDRIEAARNSLGRVPRDAVDADVLGALVSAFPVPARIFDFGGGLGTTFAALAAGLLKDSKFDFHVMELPEVAEAGTRRFRHDSRIRFVTALPPAGTPYDIVHVRTALQYVDEIPPLLERFASYGPRHILLMATAAGPQPTFASAQLNLSGSRIGYWFLNEMELVGSLERLGYRLGYTSLGHEENRQGNFPATHRIGWTRNFVFHRDA